MLTTRQILSETSPSAASTVAGTARAYGLAACEGLTVVGQLVGATGGTLDVYLQTAYDAADVADASATWFDFAPAVSTVTTIGSGTSPALAAATILGGSWGNRMRLLFTAGAGTSVGAATSVTLIGHRMQ